MVRIPKGLVLLCAAGFNLRSVLLAAPAALPAIQSQFGLSFAEAGALAAIPILVMGACALPGATVVDRIGARLAVGLAVGGLGVASLLRIAPPEAFSLFFWTAVFAAFISIAQPGLAVAARTWFATDVQSATTAYATSLNVGVVTAASVSVYLVATRGWPTTFALWSLIALGTAALWLTLAPAAPRREAMSGAVAAALRDSLLLRAALILGLQSLVFFTTTTWIPFQLRAAGTGSVSLVLFLFTAVTIPVGLFLTTLNTTWAQLRTFYVGAACLLVLGSLGLAFAPSVAPLWAISVGIGVGMVFSGGLALPNIIAPTAAHVATYAAVALTVAHTMGFLGPLIGGVIVDWTHSTAAPFLVAASGGVGVAVLGAGLPARPGVWSGDARRP